jgi:CheY-like chemotaxis protein
VGATAVVQDITVVKQAEEELKEAGRRKDAFLATLAHELRNPLAPLRVALDLLKRAKDDERLTDMARNVMDRQVGQMVRLVDELLDISRVSRGMLQLRNERVLLADILSTASETARPFIESSAHELTVSLPPRPIYLRADPTRLAQIVANLLNNAAKYTEFAGHIWLTAEQHGQDIVISVRDTGIGIESDHLGRIFEMFSQVTPALTRSQGGLGIGLSIVKALVELHGGTVEARSEGAGKGSEFVVRLPVVDRSSDSADTAEGRPQPVGTVNPYRILVVDDLRDSADSWAAMLRMMGHDTRTAYDGIEAIQSAVSFRPDVVILDIGLPKMNGYEVARRIRKEPWGNDVVLVALTGWGQKEDKQHSLNAGFDHHLTKPVEPAVLEELLARLTVGEELRG